MEKYILVSQQQQEFIHMTKGETERMRCVNRAQHHNATCWTHSFLQIKKIGQGTYGTALLFRRKDNGSRVSLRWWHDLVCSGHHLCVSPF